jgi:hypothetical protein
MTEKGHSPSDYEVRELWYEDDGSVIVYSQQVVPRQRWNHLTRPVGLLLILSALMWPLLLLAHEWTRLGLLFVPGDACVIFVAVELIRSGAKRWR